MTDEQYMRRAIEIAKCGSGFTNPNPLVGAVIVKNDKIIGEGYHAKYGELHAERNAFASLKESAEGATIYVTLEPCCHYGKTPPCTSAIIENKISRVVIGSRDPNPKVSGKGAAILRKEGITVEEDFLREECDELNDVFFHYITSKTPYVVAKYAMTADGKIATKTGASKWISTEKSRQYVAKMRGKYMGIMVGIGTVLADNPMLNARIEGARNPIRIICDSRLRIPLDCKICNTAKEIRTIVVCNIGEDKFSQEKMKEKLQKQQMLQDKGVEIINLYKKYEDVIDLKLLMERLGELGIDSILLEGGGTLNYSALKAGIVQQLNVFVAPKIFGGVDAKTAVEGIGVNEPDEAVKMHIKKIQTIDEDLLIEYSIENN